MRDMIHKIIELGQIIEDDRMMTDDNELDYFLRCHPKNKDKVVIAYYNMLDALFDDSGDTKHQVTFPVNEDLNEYDLWEMTDKFMQVLADEDLENKKIIFGRDYDVLIAPLSIPAMLFEDKDSGSFIIFTYTTGDK